MYVFIEKVPVWTRSRGEVFLKLSEAGA